MKLYPGLMPDFAMAEKPGLQDSSQDDTPSETCDQAVSCWRPGLQSQAARVDKGHRPPHPSMWGEGPCPETTPRISDIIMLELHRL